MVTAAGAPPPPATSLLCLTAARAGHWKPHGSRKDGGGGASFSPEVVGSEPMTPTRSPEPVAAVRMWRMQRGRGEDGPTVEAGDGDGEVLAGIRSRRRRIPPEGGSGAGQARGNGVGGNDAELVATVATTAGRQRQQVAARRQQRLVAAMATRCTRGRSGCRGGDSGWTMATRWLADGSSGYRGCGGRRHGGLGQLAGGVADGRTWLAWQRLEEGSEAGLAQRGVADATETGTMWEARPAAVEAGLAREARPMTGGRIGARSASGGGGGRRGARRRDRR
uniref:DUF834 domain-containing protein n=1 Tax=Oryza glumipatula TaxID=40148 RepID=A0A0E0B7G7_9ORYZ